MKQSNVETLIEFAKSNLGCAIKRERLISVSIHSRLYKEAMFREYWFICQWAFEAENKKPLVFTAPEIQQFIDRVKTDPEPWTQKK